MASTIAGLFTDASQGEAALEDLKSAGFTSAQISELADHEDEAPKKLSNPIADFFKDHTSSSSDFQESLVHLGMTPSEAQFFEDGVARGGAVITVKADERADEAIGILREHGAQSAPGHGTMNASGTAYDEAAPTAAADAIAGGMTGAGTTDRTADRVDREQTLQLRAERLAIDKTRVASGTARIGKRVVSETQSIDVPVSHDELVIERRAVSGAPVEGTIGGGERTIEVPLSRDQVNVGKQTYATEEVEVGTRRVEGVERVTDTVRHEELVVENDERGRNTAL